MNLQSSYGLSCVMCVFVAIAFLLYHMEYMYNVLRVLHQMLMFEYFNVYPANMHVNVYALQPQKFRFNIEN